MTDKPSIQKPILLLVEGADYFHFLREKTNELAPNIQIFDYKTPMSKIPRSSKEGGQNASLNGYISFLKSQAEDFSKVKRIGILCDAEDSKTNMQASIKSILIKQNINIISDYLILPINQEQGCLENSMLAAISDKSFITCAEEFLKCTNAYTKNIQYEAKRLVHSIISAKCKNPAATLGQSSESGLWDYSHPELASVIDFIIKLNSHA